jgi:hypothetical protein
VKLEILVERIRRGECWFVRTTRSSLLDDHGHVRDHHGHHDRDHVRNHHVLCEERDIHLVDAIITKGLREWD